jgi:hypothetical protein
MDDRVQLLGVKRGSKFSPNHIGNDEAIFNQTVIELYKRGYEITICSEDEFMGIREVMHRNIFSMAREKAVVAKLQQLEDEGRIVCNSGYGIENCFRINMTEGLIKNNIPYPKSNIVSTSNPGNNAFDNLPGEGFWIKRGDFHAIHKEDVTYVESETQGRYILNEFSLRGIKDAVISQNLSGDLVKFYGVRGTDFFYCFYPYDHNHHKYAEYETINGATFHYNFDQLELKRVSDRAAIALDIHIYGGDAIVDKRGKFNIIDFNDWPSFAPCRDSAAIDIAICLANNFTTKK